MLEDLLNEIKELKERVSFLANLCLQQTNSLTTYKDVARFLGLTTRTIYNYIKDAKLVRDKHYYINANGKTVFIPKAIMEFKQSALQIQGNEQSKSIGSRVMHQIASKVLQGVA